jgi:hypothetical protein
LLLWNLSKKYPSFENMFTGLAVLEVAEFGVDGLLAREGEIAKLTYGFGVLLELDSV